MSSTKTKGTKKSKETIKTKKKSDEPKVSVPNPWIDDLIQKQINDDDWSCSVVLIEEACVDASLFLEVFNNAAAKGNRLAVKSISFMDVKELIRKAIVKEKSKTSSAFDLLCMEIYSVVGPGFQNVIPTSLLAHLLKYMILEEKSLNKQIRNNIGNKHKDEEDYFQSLWPLANNKGVSAKSFKTGIKSDASGKSGINKSKPKAFTKLRKRGEEWMDMIWIDDAPINGPKLYIAVSSFYDTNLPLELLKINVPLDAIVELDMSSKNDCATERKFTPLQVVGKKTTMEKLLIEKKRSQIYNFWKEIELMKTNPPTSFMFKNLMFLRLECQYLQGKCVFPEEIYRKVSHFMYDIFDNYVLFESYLDALDSIDVTDDNIHVPPSMKVYNSILDSIPHEALTLACVLDAILAQVCSSEVIETSKESEEMEELQTDSISLDSIMKLLQRLNIEYDVLQESQILSNTCSSTTVVDTLLPIKIILVYSDYVRIKSFHFQQDLTNFITLKTYEVLKCAWKFFWVKYFTQQNCDHNFIKLCNSIVDSRNITECTSSYCYVYILIVNCILDCLLMRSYCNLKEQTNCKIKDRPSTEKYRESELCDDCLLEINTATGVHNSFKNCLLRSDESVNCSKDSNEGSSYSLTSDIIANNNLYTEEMPSEILLQNLQADIASFSKFETKYCPLTDQLVIVFHDLHSLLGPSKDIWVGTLRTKVPVRDFVEYILEEEFDLFENLINNSFSEGTSSTILSHVTLINYNIPNTFVLPDSVFVSHRSLKYKKVQEEQQLANLAEKEADKASVAGATNSYASDAFGGNQGEVKESLVKLQQRFTVYQLGEPQRIQFTGSVTEKLFGDSTKITIEKVQELYGGKSHNVSVNVNGHTLYYHYKPNSVYTPQVHFVLSSGIILYFTRSSIDINKSSTDINNEQILGTLPELLEDDVENSQNHVLSNSGKISDDMDPGKSDYLNQFAHELKTCKFHEIPVSFDLKMSTPSGLHIELINLKHKEIMYVRQELLSKNKGEKVKSEKFRCYSNCGYIIKFMFNGEIEIMGGNGAIYLVDKIKENHANVEDDILGVQNEITIEKDRPSLTGEKSQKKNKKKTSSKKKDEKVKTSTSIHSEQSFKEPKTDFGFNISNYTYTSLEGRRYIVNDSTQERIEDLFIISSLENNSIHSERLDGLTSVHNADGSLTVNYPDGTCMTSYPVEAGEVFCEWSTSELDLWFSMSELDASSSVPSSNVSLPSKIQADCLEELVSSLQTKSADHSDQLTAKKKEISAVISETSQRASLSAGEVHSSVIDVNRSNDLVKSYDSTKKKWKKILYSEDGFVVYTLNYLMAHPYYCSIYYNIDECEVEFDLPFSTSVHLKSDGNYMALFEGGNAIVEKGVVCLNKLSKDGQIIHKVFVNTDIHMKEPIHDLQTGRANTECFDQATLNSMSSKMQKGLSSLGNFDSNLIYSVDELGDKFIVDFSLNVSEFCESEVLPNLQGSEYCSYVINRDLSGLKLVGSLEFDKHIELVHKIGGLEIKKEGYSSILTTMPVIKNESQKWLMQTQDNLKSDQRFGILPSTFGRRGSWTKPFISHDENNLRLFESEVMICRVLNVISTRQSVMSDLKTALEQFKHSSRISKSPSPLQITIEPGKGGLKMCEIVNDPKILCQLYKEEERKFEKENDQFRNNLKNSFLQTLIYQACIKSRKDRQRSKVEEFKYILRTKTIPPYHLSCFGQVHSILEEVLEDVSNMRCTSSSSLGVSCIIDELLSMAITASTKEKKENDVQELVNEIFENFCDISRKKSHQKLVVAILEKPLSLVTSEEVQLLCQTFQSGAGDCPILYEEEFILQDVLEARHQLCHYFSNLKEMLKYYRDNVMMYYFQKNTDDVIP